MFLHRNDHCVLIANNLDEKLNLMKKLSFITIVLCLLTFISCKPNEKVAETSTTPETTAENERPRRGPRGRGGEQMRQQQQEMMAALNMTDRQKEKMQAVNQKFREKMRAMRENSNGDRATMRGEMMKMRQEMDKQIQGILTVEQYKKYKKLMEERRQQRGGRRGNRGS